MVALRGEVRSEAIQLVQRHWARVHDDFRGWTGTETGGIAVLCAASCEGELMTTETQNRLNEVPNVRVLLVSEESEDHEYLGDLFGDPACGLTAECRWALHSAHSIHSALAVLEAHAIPIVLSACELGPDTWRAMLDALAALSEPPLLILISRLDDERLWAEALNLGAYDLLAKPFEANEVVRIIGRAWLHWAELHEDDAARNRRYKTVHAY